MALLNGLGESPQVITDDSDYSDYSPSGYGTFGPVIPSAPPPAPTPTRRKRATKETYDVDFVNSLPVDSSPPSDEIDVDYVNSLPVNRPPTSSNPIAQFFGGSQLPSWVLPAAGGVAVLGLLYYFSRKKGRR